jgi:hypothetical protein
VHVGDDVLTVDGQRGTARVTQCGVQHGAVLGRVDVHAGEHRVAVLLQAGGAGQIHQQRQGLAGDAVLAVVDVEISYGHGQFGAPGGILCEKFTQVFLADLVAMTLQRLPGGSGCDVSRNIRQLRVVSHGTDINDIGAVLRPKV